MGDETSIALVAALGAYHGLNPAMGWLFAVGLGLQDRSRSALLGALGPIALGHELAIVLVGGLVVVLGVVADAEPLRLGAAIVLVAFGLFRFARPRAHPRWVKSRVNRRELTWWSFLMSSAHGAGLMVAPLLIGASAGGGHEHVESVGPMAQTVVVMTLHVATMLVVMAAIALLVYEKLGVAVLQRAWVNTDHAWAAAFVVAGLATLFS